GAGAPAVVRRRVRCRGGPGRCRRRPGGPRCLCLRCFRARGRGGRPGGVLGGPGTRHADVALAVGGRPGPGAGPGRRGQPQARLTDPQQRARRQPDRAGADGAAVQGGAVGGAEVGDGDPAVGADGDRAVQAGDVGVVERHVGVGGAADADLAAVQQMHPARAGARGDGGSGRGRAGRPSRVVPLVVPRSATAARPAEPTVTAQGRRETSGSSGGTSASAERPMRISPPCSRCTPPASGPATTCSRVGASSSSGCASGSPGAPTASTAPSISGGSPRVQRWASSRWSPAYSTGVPEELSAPATAEASAEATAARAVPAGAVTSTSQLGVRSRA